MPALVVQISRFVDEHQPGFVECTLVDAQGERHVFIEKVPIVTTENLWSTCIYPQFGAIPCEVEAEWQDPQGRSLVEVTTERPFHVESTQGQARFVVLASMLQP